MKLFRYYGYMCGEHISGIVKANNLQEAKEMLRNTYDDYNMWKHKKLEEVEFNNNNVYEVFYG